MFILFQTLIDITREYDQIALFLTHKISSSFPRYLHSIKRRDLAGSTKVNQLDVKSAPGYHNDIVRLQVQVHDADVM